MVERAVKFSRGFQPSVTVLRRGPGPRSEAREQQSASPARKACLLLIEVERSECPHEQAVMMCCGAGDAGGRSDVHLVGLPCPREVARLLIMLYPVTVPETARPVMASGSNTTRVRVATHRAQRALHHGLARRTAGTALSQLMPKYVHADPWVSGRGLPGGDGRDSQKAISARALAASVAAVAAAAAAVVVS